MTELSPNHSSRTSPPSQLSIVILSHNRLDDLKATVDHYVAIAPRDTEIVVIDNASTDGSRQYLKSLNASQGHQFRSVLNVENEGVARGRNHGMAVTRGRYVLHSDDDCQLRNTDLSLLLKRAEMDPRSGIVFPRVAHAVTGKAQTPSHIGSSAANFHGACFLLRRDAWESAGGLDPECAFGGEELDFSLRVKAAGFRLCFAPEALALHNSMERQGSEGAWRRVQWIRNYTRIVAMRFPLSMSVPFALRLLASHALSALRCCGPATGLRVTAAALTGWLSGRTAYAPLPDEVLREYRSKDLRPDYGNAPLLAKAFKRRKST